MRSGSGKEFFPPSLFFGLKKGWCGVWSVGRWQKKKRKKSCCLRNGRGGGEQETRSKSLPSPFFFWRGLPLPPPPPPMNFSGRPHTSSLPCGKRGGGGEDEESSFAPLVARSIFLFHRCAEGSRRRIWLRREISILYMSPLHFRAMATLKNVSPASFSSPSSYPRIDEHPPTLFYRLPHPSLSHFLGKHHPERGFVADAQKSLFPLFPPSLPSPPLPTLSPFKL